MKLKDPRAWAIRSAASGFSQITKSYGRSIMLLNLKYPSLLIIVLNNNNNNKQIKAFKPGDIYLHNSSLKKCCCGIQKIRPLATGFGAKNSI
ncbi:MAG TPA: hypothetical protein VE223_01830 [Nitrososphaeraceae archaeon]|nr:hypothetical protein [Nitrososphaeraceae archaeon]